jgi:hypothetical protein
MDILLSPDWRLTGEEHNYVLWSKTDGVNIISKKRVKPGWKHYGYYSLLEHALESFVDTLLRASDVETIKELNDTMNNYKALKSLFKGLK